MQVDPDGVVREAVLAVAPGDRAAQHAADGAVDVAHPELEPDRVTALQRGGGQLDEPLVEDVLEVVLLGTGVVGLLGRRLGAVEEGGEVEAPRLPVLDVGAGLEQVAATDQLLETAESQRRHPLAHVLGDEEHEGDHVLGCAGEPLAQLGVVGGDPHRAGVEVADPHHHAAGGDERRGAETELVGAEHGPDQHVAPRLELAVDLEDDPAAQTLGHQHLLGLREPQLPGNTRVLDGGERGGAGATVVAGDDDVVRPGLGHPGGDRAHPDLGDQLDADPGLGVGHLEVVDELGEVLDRVDVVVRRR